MTNQHRDKVDKMRTAGLYTKGIVYALIGALTAMAAFGLGGDIKGRKGIVDFLMNQPAGSVLVGIVALGLLCYSLWRLYECVQDPDGREDENRVGSRLKYLYSGLVYGFIAYSFAKPLIGGGSGGGSGSGGSKKKAALAEMLEKDWGVWVIGAIAIIVLAMAAYQIYRGISEKYMDKIENHQGSREKYQTVKNLGKVGYIARGIVFAILAFFLYKVITAHSADQYKGTEGAFQWMLKQDYGTWLMGAVALGLLAYGIFTMAVARYSSLTRMG